MKRILVLGGGTAGTLIANKMAQALPPEWAITVVDRDEAHVYQPGLLLLPFGLISERELVRPRRSLLDARVELVLGELERIDPVAKVVTVNATPPITLAYDLLVIATGTYVRPELTTGMTGPLWRKDVHEFYTLEGSKALTRRLEAFEGGRLVINIVDMPIKCPVAPLEFAFLVEAHLQQRGLRERTELVYATPLDGAFTKPRASQAFGSMMQDRGIEVVRNFNASAVEGHALQAYDGRSLPFDLLVTVPLHGGAEVLTRAGLGDALGFVPTDLHTLQSKAHPDVFALGDATDLPSSKAGAVAHFQGEVLAKNLLRHLAGLPLLPDFDGHANCFVETGHGKAMLIDFNYDTEPLPGRFPLPGVGPFTLLEESHTNHWGKLAFQWLYWNAIVRGKELPLDHRMLLAGKRRDP